MAIAQKPNFRSVGGVQAIKNYPLPKRKTFELNIAAKQLYLNEFLGNGNVHPSGEDAHVLCSLFHDEFAAGSYMLWPIRYVESSRWRKSSFQSVANGTCNDNILGRICTPSAQRNNVIFFSKHKRLKINQKIPTTVYASMSTLREGIPKKFRHMKFLLDFTI